MWKKNIHEREREREREKREKSKNLSGGLLLFSGS
jgi:hypothetical protein